MDDGFKDRVDRVFGSISSSSSSPPWSLSDVQLQTDRHKEDVDVDDDDDDVFSNCQFQTKSLDDDDGQNEWDIRSSIGLDSTLDNEEEEDAYDKIALGMENCGDRLYMKDVTNPTSLHVNDAAKTRFKEDMSDAEDGIIRIKSILKRKSCDEVSKPAKRVSFHSTCKNVIDAINPDPPEHGPGVPDYILNPSKYTRYTFDDPCHVNDEQEGSSKHDGCDLPKSVIFIPRKKRDDKQSACSAIGISAVKVQQCEEACEMEEDDICTKARRLKKQQLRHYRSKIEEYDDVS